MPHLLADARLLENVDFLLSIGLLVVVILGGGIVLLWLDRWRKKQAAGKTKSVDALSAYRELYDRGELTRSEYETIRAQLAHQMREELDLALAARKKTKTKADGRRPSED